MEGTRRMRGGIRYEDEYSMSSGNRATLTDNSGALASDRAVQTVNTSSGSRKQTGRGKFPFPVSVRQTAMLASCNSRRGLTRLRRTIVTLMTTLRPPMCNKSSSVWLTLHDGQHPLEYYHTCARGNTVNEPDPPRPLMVAVLQCYDAATTHYSSLTKL